MIELPLLLLTWLGSGALLTSSSELTNEMVVKDMSDFDFGQIDNLDGWFESSDTVREPGKSKASFVLQKTQVFQRAIFFSVLNPQENGAGFAGYRVGTDLDLSAVNGLQIRCRSQGSATHYKILLRDESSITGDGSFEAVFQPSSESFTETQVPFSEFKFYYRGQVQPDHEPLDRSKILSIGLQVFGGVYSEFKQSGASALEIDWIKTV
ncbi:hypothetical protein TCAL_12559 [Tigriopus californicus]|uniref:NADH:ubiquinone oxidoreductase intermediate-associated protein 30 domain-containing protein n=1 Tax=Tigriopus californicus TaxID=6832 RepID=A0A553PHP6_TIGCA|nr:hypothetical protein TCAL_12559 [Tigriopus californicus]|eukprot:TCALIF_12559-PA protein Name:"Protein of unknown function" AED:0.06 eAED:0.06 QI:43/1/0.75/1/1/0.75/4/0/208